MPRADLAIGGQPRGDSDIGSARDRERTQVEIVIGITLVINDGTHDIGAIKSVPAAAVIVPEVVIEVERLSAL